MKGKIVQKIIKWKCRTDVSFSTQTTFTNVWILTLSMLVRRHTRINEHIEIYLHAQIQYVKNALKNVLISMWINVFLKPYGWVNCCKLTSEMNVSLSIVGKQKLEAWRIVSWLIRTLLSQWVTFSVSSSAAGMSEGVFWLCREEHHPERASNSFWQNNMTVLLAGGDMDNDTTMVAGLEKPESWILLLLHSQSLFLFNDRT